MSLSLLPASEYQILKVKIFSFGYLKEEVSVGHSFSTMIFFKDTFDQKNHGEKRIQSNFTIDCKTLV
jgi:hypothetical protein